MAAKGERKKQGGDQKSKSHDVISKLSDLNLTPAESSRFQKLAEISEEDFVEDSLAFVERLE
jgi:hypothetical protein